MKKIIKNRIFIFLITAILFAGIGVYAGTKYQASEILYNPSSGDSMTVNDALNEIYNIKKLGTATADDIIKGKTAVVQGELITGTMQNNFLSGDDLISNFSTTYAKKNYVDDAATASFQTSTNIDFSKYNFITINYYIHSVNRPKATVTVAGTVFSICPYSGTYTISIPVSDINIVGSIIFNAKDSGGGTSDIKYVQIQVNSIYGY